MPSLNLLSLINVVFGNKRNNITNCDCVLTCSHSTDVRAKFDANNLAYTTDGILLHGDLPYLDYQPGVSKSREKGNNM